MICCSSKNSRGLTIRQSDLNRYQSKYRYNDIKEIIDLRERFTYLSNSKQKINKEDFRENMGLLGLDSGIFLTDRIFAVIDFDDDGELDLEDFLHYFDILMYGDAEEKSKLTFKMIDIDADGYFNFDEFSSLIYSILQCWNNITGNQLDVKNNIKLRNFIENVFNKFDGHKDGKVTLDTFKKVVIQEPELLEIFDYFNKGISESLNPFGEIDPKDQKILDDIEVLENKMLALKIYLDGKGDEIVLEQKNPEKPSGTKAPHDIRSSAVMKNLDNITKSAFFKPLKEDLSRQESRNLTIEAKNSFRETNILRKSLSPNNCQTVVKSINFEMNAKAKSDVPNIFTDHVVIDEEPIEATIKMSRIVPQLESFQDLMNQIQNSSYANLEPLAYHQEKIILEQVQPKVFTNMHNEEALPEALHSNNSQNFPPKFSKSPKGLFEKPLSELAISRLISEAHSKDINTPTDNHEIAFPSKSREEFIYEKKNSELDGIKGKECENNIQVGDDDTILRTTSFAKKLKEPVIRSITTMPRNDTIINDNNFPQPTSRMNIYRGTINENENKYEIERLKKASNKLEEIIHYTKKLAEEIKSKQKNTEEKKAEENHLKFMKDITAQNIPRSKTANQSGSFVFFGHQNWNLVLNMMLGIQMAVKSVNNNTREQLNANDFKLKYYFELVPRRTSETKNSFKICTFFDYAPYVFYEIRKIYGIKNEDYLRSIGPEGMLNNLLKGNISSLAELTSTGKSGSFFYFSADSKYTLKTIPREEFNFLKSILRNYYNHLVSNPNSLIIKFYGCHKIRFTKSRTTKEKIYFVIMSNIFHTTKEINLRYDLKGSTYGRWTPEDSDSSIAKKDLNLIKRGDRIYLTKSYANFFLSQIKRDCAFFEQNNIIDYSLLIGVHNLNKEKIDITEKSNLPSGMRDSLQKKIIEEKFSSNEGILSTDGKCLYFMGIIDILTNFKSRKKLEYCFKRIMYGKGISAVPPSQYAERFEKFIASVTKVN